MRCQIHEFADSQTAFRSADEVDAPVSAARNDEKCPQMVLYEIGKNRQGVEQAIAVVAASNAYALPSPQDCQVQAHCLVRRDQPGRVRQRGQSTPFSKARAVNRGTPLEFVSQMSYAQRHCAVHACVGEELPREQNKSLESSWRATSHLRRVIARAGNPRARVRRWFGVPTVQQSINVNSSWHPGFVRQHFSDRLVDRRHRRDHVHMSPMMG